MLDISSDIEHEHIYSRISAHSLCANEKGKVTKLVKQ